MNRRPPSRKIRHRTNEAIQNGVHTGEDSDSVVIRLAVEGSIHGMLQRGS